MQVEKIKERLGDKAVFDEQGNFTIKHPDLPEFKMIFVQGGEFIMGDGTENNNPEHKVIVSSFFIGQVPVTQELYEAVMKENPSYFKGKLRPVENVSWYDSVNFCIKLNNLLSLDQPVDKATDNARIDLHKCGFRLPSEAEWEYAAWGGKYWKQNYKYAGSNYLHQVGWYRGNNDFSTRAVGLKKPNQLGIYDMSGNVLEWCLDWYDKYFYKNSPAKDPVNTRKASGRVVRGGSWYGVAIGGRLVPHYFRRPGFRDDLNGFRLVFSCR